MTINPAPWPNHARPLDTAQRLVEEVFSDQLGQPTLGWWRESWWRYTGSHWLETQDELDVREHIWRALQGATMDQGNGIEPVPWNPTTARVSNLIEPLRIAALRPGAKPIPAWLPRYDSDPDPRRVVPLRNGLFVLDTGELLPHTPRYVQTWSLPFKYDQDADCPIWLQFLAETLEHDPRGQQALQEFAGYLISGQTHMHKALMLIGPKRGGKGTISRVLQQLQGTENTVGTSFSDLSSDFGLAELIGKPLAVIEDARAADHPRKSNRALERLLNVIGEDTVSANRKNQRYWVGKLPTRFVLVSNETPRFNDPSGAITSRFVAIKLNHTVPDDKRDPDLGAKLATELPGIFAWALEGLRRLEQQGQFTTPDTQNDVLEVMEALASPLAEFFEETSYRVTSNHANYVEASRLFQDYRKHTAENGGTPASRNVFLQRLLDHYPGVIQKNTKADGVRKTRWIFGVTDQA